MKKMFLENLPKRGKLIDWKNSIGHKIPFIYDDIEGNVEIVKLTNDNPSKLIIKYDDNVFYDKPISTQNFKHCRIGCYLGKYTLEFKIPLGKLDTNDNRNMIIIDREYRDNPYNEGKKLKYYKYKCSKCGNEEWILESSLIGGNGCNACSKIGRKILKLGINTIWDTDRWMVDLGVSEKDAKAHSKGSNDKVLVKCPNCGNEKNVELVKIYTNKSIGCTCGDGFSYPEKFVYSTLKQLGISFETQLSKLTFDWCDKYKYDFYLPDYNMIIETHGIQHYEQTNRKSARTLLEEQENDRLKEQLAKENKVENYVVLDCRYSDLEWIKNSILNSKLTEFFDLYKVDWLKCEEYSIKSNLVKEVCDYWNNKEEWETIYTIASERKLDVKSAYGITKYLKIGTKLGWCNYNGKEEREKQTKKLSKKVEIFKDDKSLGIFESVAELSRQSNDVAGVDLKISSIAKACNGDLKTYKGFTFRYVEEN